MKIYSADKTKELKISEVDLEKGYLIEEKIFICHHDAIDAVEEKWHYEIVAEYDNGGKDIIKVIDIARIEAQEAYDEYEIVKVYILYTERELEEKAKDKMRFLRKSILVAYDRYKTNVIYGIEKESVEDRQYMLDWYHMILNLNIEAFNKVPDKVKYYMN